LHRLKDSDLIAGDWVLVRGKRIEKTASLIIFPMQPMFDLEIATALKPDPKI
jgi:hypothetical protein